jgi:hypothetical protein
MPNQATTHTSPSKNEHASTTRVSQQVEMNPPKFEHKTGGGDMPKETNTQGEKQTAQEKLDSYYAGKDLAWWIELARDFKRATKIPLPEETDIDL